MFGLLRGGSISKSVELTRKEADIILKDVPVDNEFIFRDGTRLKNLHGLSIKLSVLSDEDFGFHVNDDKNDFKSWIEEVIKDKTLADEISKIKNRKEMKAVIDAKIRLCRTVIHENVLSKKKELPSQPPAFDARLASATEKLSGKGIGDTAVESKGVQKAAEKVTFAPSSLDLSIEHQAKTFTPAGPEHIPHDSMRQITHSFLHFLLGLCVGIIVGVIVTRLAL